MCSARDTRFRFTKATIGAGALVLAAVVAGPTATPAPAPDDVVLNDFESPDALDGVTFPAPDLDDAVITDTFATEGQASMRFDLGGFETAEGKIFPRVWLNVGTTVPDVDWTQKDYLHIGAANGSLEPATMYVVVWDKAGRYIQRSVVAQPFEYHVFQIKTADIAAGGVDLSRLDKIQISSQRSVNPKHLYVDDIRLTDVPADVPAERAAAAQALVRMMDLPGTLATARESFEAVRDKVRPVPFAPEAALNEQADAIDARLDDYAQQIPSLVDEVGEARSIWFGLNDLDWDVKRWSGLVDARAASPVSPVGIAFADSMSRVYPRDLPCDCDYGRSTELDMVRGEHEAVQLVAVPYGSGLAEASVEASVVAGPSDGLSVDAHPVVSLNMVPPVVQPPARPTDFRPSVYEGWTPDPIQTARDRVDVADGDLQAFWVALETAPDAKAGVYQVRLMLTADGVPAQRATVKVRVHDAEIAAEPELRTAIGHDPVAYAGAYGVTDPDEAQAMVDEEYEFLGEYLLQGDNIYRSIYEHKPPSVERLRRIDEQYGGLRQFNIWYFDPRLFNLAAPETWDAQADEIFDLIQPYVDEYRAAGLIDKAYFYCCDETRAEHFELVKQVLTRFKERFPEIDVMTTMIDDNMGRSTGLAQLQDLWVRDVPWYNREIVDERHAAGDEAWWYLHAGNRNPTPNMFVNYDPGPLRTLLGPMSFQADIDGFLYYRVDRWYGNGILDDAPLSSWGPRTWNNYAGDGALLYPGPDGPIPSIRLENVRDGLEDYNLLAALRRAIDDAPAGTDPDLLDRAERLLGATDVVTDNYEYVIDPGEYRDWRADVAGTVDKLT